jgi:hypothetical protein
MDVSNASRAVNVQTNIDTAAHASLPDLQSQRTQNRPGEYAGAISQNKMPGSHPTMRPPVGRNI